MNREILFRGKHIHVLPGNEHLDGRWIEGYLSSKDYINSPELEGEFLVDENTICQYTGLTDKNGRKIFEGDYISLKQYVGGNQIDYHVELGYVEMKHGAFGLHREQGYYRPFKDWLEDYEYEVIGNIFDNPELIN